MAADSRTLWFAYSQPVDGLEAEYDRWYDEVHLHQVKAVPGVVSAQRYKSSPGPDLPCQDLTVYEIDGDPDVVLAELRRRLGAGLLDLSPALDPAGNRQAVWHPHGPRLT